MDIVRNLCGRDYLDPAKYSDMNPPPVHSEDVTF